MYLQSRRTFLKGAAFSLAGVAIVKGVFSTNAAAESVTNSKFTDTPDTLSFYPDQSEWDNFQELDGTDWKRGGISRKGVKSPENPDGIQVNNYTIVPTVCSNCEAGCGLTAWVNTNDFEKGKLTVRKYMGNPLHTGSKGRNCAKGYAVTSQMYDPDRIPFPIKRAPGSKRGEGKWVRVTWDEAMTVIGKKMHDTLAKGDAISKKSIMYHVGRPNENGFGPRVPQSLGIDGYNSHTNICSAGAREGTIQWTNDDRNSPDWKNADLIFLQSSHAADAGHYFQQSAGLIAEARKRGAKMIVIDPRMSNSAGMADLWLPCWPGTEAALYLYLVNRIVHETGKNGDDLIEHDFVKNWVNWDRLMANKAYLEKMVGYSYISKLPEDDSYESFVKVLQELYAPYTKEFVVKECRLEGMEYKLDELWEMFVPAGAKIATYLWRAGPIGHRGGWMNTRAGFLPLVLRGAMRGDIGGTGLHHWHEISVAGKGDKATLAGEHPKPTDEWNEIAWPPEYPVSTYELGYMMPHILMDDEWHAKWTKRGMQIPKSMAVYIPRMHNPLWINPDGFRWIEALKREDKFELSFNLSPTWSETNWYCDYVLPVGLAGERNDQQSTPSKPEQRIEFRQAVLRVAAEKAGWKAKDPTRATLEAHMKFGLGEVWEESEFWPNLIVHHVDPDGSLGVKKYWQSKKDPSRCVTVPEYFDAALSLLPKLKETATKLYKDEEYPVYSYIRDHGAWTEKTDVYKPQEEELEFDGEFYHAHGKKHAVEDVTKDKFGALWVEDGDFKKSIGIEIDGKIHDGFHTLSKKLEFFCEWLADEWKWPEYAIPIYPRNEDENDKMVHIVTQVHHKHMKADNEFALNTIYRLPYNIHTRSVNSKHLMEISQNHNPVWIYTKDADKLGIKRGDAIKVQITDTLSGIDSGYFIAMAVPTEATRPGVLACSHHAGRWKLKNSVTIPGFEHKLGVMGLGAPLFEMTNDGKVGTMKPKEGIHPYSKEERWQFTEYNKDLDDIWWDGLSGSWQNAVAPCHPDPIAGNHGWHQKVVITKAAADEVIGDIYVNYENNLKVAKAWRDDLTRPLEPGDTLRRPYHIKRPVKPSQKAYKVEIKDV